MASSAQDFITYQMNDDFLDKRRTVTLKNFKKPLTVEVRGLTTDEQLHLIKQSSVTYPPATVGASEKVDIDLYAFSANTVIAGVTSIDLYDTELQAAYGVYSAVELVYKMFRGDDLKAVSDAIAAISQDKPESTGVTPEQANEAKK